MEVELTLSVCVCVCVCVCVGVIGFSSINSFIFLDKVLQLSFSFSLLFVSFLCFVLVTFVRCCNYFNTVYGNVLVCVSMCLCLCLCVCFPWPLA